MAMITLASTRIPTSTPARSTTPGAWRASGSGKPAPPPANTTDKPIATMITVVSQIATPPPSGVGSRCPL